MMRVCVCLLNTLSLSFIWRVSLFNYEGRGKRQKKERAFFFSVRALQGCCYYNAALEPKTRFVGRFF